MKLAILTIISVILISQIVLAERVCNEGACIEIQEVNPIDVIILKIQNLFNLFSVTPNPAQPGTTVTQTDGFEISCSGLSSFCQQQMGDYSTWYSTWYCNFLRPDGSISGSVSTTSCCDCSAMVSCSYTIPFNAQTGTWQAVMSGVAKTLPSCEVGYTSTPFAVQAAQPFCQSCQDMNKFCGSWTNNCGNILNCGTCPSGQICEDGHCTIPQCQNGERRCKASTQQIVQECQNWVWYDVQACGTNEICSNGQCILSMSCGDGQCNNGETCQTCPQDCGQCTCVPYWSCTDWSDCVGGEQTRTCTDLNSCGTTSGKPATLQSCQGPCTPKTCTELNKQCGVWDDECEGTINCGDCDSGYTCDAGTCIYSGNGQGCTPTTCTKEGKNCGTINDGCGLTMNCGNCNEGYTCINNICKEDGSDNGDGTITQEDIGLIIFALIILFAVIIIVRR